MQRRNLAKKITINTMKIKNSANYFAGLQIASAMGKNEFPRKKNVPEDLLPSVKQKPILSDLPEIHAFISESFLRMILTLIILEFNLVFFLLKL